MFIQCLRGGCTRETTIYTIVGLFASKTAKWTNTVTEMMGKQGYFTSFMHFLKEFQIARWPTLQHEALAEIHICKQRQDESISVYADRWQELHDIVKWDVDSRLDFFISGLKNDKVREKVSTDYFEPNTRTFAEVRKRAEHMQACLAIGQVMDKHNPKRSVNAVSSTKQPSSQKKKTEKSVSAVAPSKSSGSAKNTSKPTTTKTTLPPLDDKWKDRRANAFKAMKQMGVTGCYGCLGDHKWLQTWENCESKCPFCARDQKGFKNRHLAFECNKKPSDKESVLRMIKKQK